MMAEPSDGVLLAHYGKKRPRRLGPPLHINAEEISMRVADNDLASKLQRACHVRSTACTRLQQALPAWRLRSVLQQVGRVPEREPGHPDRAAGGIPIRGVTPPRIRSSPEARAASVQHGSFSTEGGVRAYYIRRLWKNAAGDDERHGGRTGQDRRVEIAKAGCS